MTEDRLAAIKARQTQVEEARAAIGPTGGTRGVLVDRLCAVALDVPYLLSEVEWLRTDLNSLRSIVATVDVPEDAPSYMESYPSTPVRFDV